MFPYAWQRLINEIRKQVEQYSLMCGDRDSRLSFTRFVTGEYLIRRAQSYPIIDLTLSLQQHLFVEFKYNYRNSDRTDTDTWGDLISLDVDEHDRTAFQYKDSKFRDEAELAHFLLTPLTDPNFVPPASQ